MITKKEFKVTIDNKDVLLYFKHPTQEEIFKLDLVYRVAFANAMRQGVMCEAEARKVFKESGAWTSEDENKINMLTLKIAQLETIVKAFLQGSNPEEKNEDDINNMVTELMTLRNDHLTLIGTRTSLFRQTAEGAADEQRMHKFVELCCYRSEDEEKLFGSHDEYINFLMEQHDAESEIYKQAYMFEYGLPEDISAGWAEVEWLKHYKASAKTEEIPEAKPKKKRGRKPKQQ